MTSPHLPPLKRFRWLISAAALALMPKCAGCLLAYLALATGLGVVDREICGAAAPGSGLLAATIARLGFPPALADHPSLSFALFVGLIGGVTLAVRSGCRRCADRRRPLS